MTRFPTVPRSSSRPSEFLGGARAYAVLIMLCLLVFAPAAIAKNGAFKSTLHGNPEKGPQRRADKGRGSCSQCHVPHEAHRQGTGNPSGLFTANDNNLCFNCHDRASEDGVFPGRSAWARSTHGSDRRVTGGHPDAAKAVEPNHCNNCHEPHGNKDKDGVIPAMLHAREPEACMKCHDGSRASDIRSATVQPFIHGEWSRGKHDPREGGRASSHGNSNRHVSCSDCHNVHSAAADRSRRQAPEASARLAGVSRVQVTNGGAGTVPNFTYRGADDAAGALEYEICFKCHSSWTDLTGRQEDLAVLTNPQNPSFHPIQAPGKNRGIRPDAFVNGFDSDSQITCTDCHGSSNDRVAGLHGSTNEHLLRAPAVSTTMPTRLQHDNLCFRCHAYGTYASASPEEAERRASRFNGPATAGHTFHVGEQRIPCYSCHETHGSTRHPALIASGKGRGIVQYSQTPNGGTCASTCHEARTYTLNYAR